MTSYKYVVVSYHLLELRVVICDRVDMFPFNSFTKFLPVENTQSDIPNGSI